MPEREPEHLETVVIGGGQAGLAVGHHLARRGRPFLILDAHQRVGDAWRTRWDSLRLFTPGRYNGLAGLPFPAPAHSFPTKDQGADYTLAAFLAPDDLPQALLTGHDGEPPASLATVAGDPLALGDAVAALRRHSLVRLVADGLFVHRLLQTVIRTSLDPEAQRAWTSVAVLLLRAAFPDDSDEVATWPSYDRLLPHALVVADHAQGLDVEPEARLWLLSQAAMYLWRRGRYRQALTLQEQALSGYRRMFGDDHPDTLTSMRYLAETRRALGDLHGARELHEQTLAARQRVLGNNHPDTLTSMSSLAETRRDVGDLDGARQLHEQALATRRRVLGDDHPDTLLSMSNLEVVRREIAELQA